jgi:tetratricopeptide (TPR) repeat protein
MNDYKYYVDKGIFEFQEGKYNEALADIDQSIKLKNDWEISYFYRGAVHHALGNFDEAMLDYTKAIQINPNMVDAYYNKAKITLSRKDIQNPNMHKVISDLEKALELDDKFIDALFAMAVAYKNLEDYHKSLEFLEKLLQIEPEAVNARALKKLILQKYMVK